MKARRIIYPILLNFNIINNRYFVNKYEFCFSISIILSGTDSIDVTLVIDLFSNIYDILQITKFKIK